MFDFFKNRRLKKKLKEKYGKEITTHDINSARERMRRQNNFLDDSNTNVLMWMMIHGVDEDNKQHESYSYNSKQDTNNTTTYNDTTPKSAYTPSSESNDSSSSSYSSSSTDYSSSSSYSSDSGSSSSF